MGTVYIFRGKAAIGKSTLSDLPAKKLSIPVIRKDDIVDALKSIGNIDRSLINNEVCYNILSMKRESTSFTSNRTSLCRESTSYQDDEDARVGKPVISRVCRFDSCMVRQEYDALILLKGLKQMILN